MPPSTVATSAPGKVLLAGGYLVLDRKHTGLVFGLSARINVVTSHIPTIEGVELNEIVVESPQFVDAQWRYGYRASTDGVKVTQLQVGPELKANPFVETTLSYALSYIHHVGKKDMSPAKVTILADDDYYSNPGTATTSKGERFVSFGVPLSGAHKTGLGSSAALVTSLTASLLSYYLTLDLDTDRGRRTLHNLAQAAHCAAQGKVGSGFDVAAAVYGSCLYRRFSPDVLSAVPEAGSPGFAERLAAVVDDAAGDVWDVEVAGGDVRLPPGVVLRMCDVDCGSQTVGMVKKVLTWRGHEPDASARLWGELQTRNEDLAAALRDGGDRGEEQVAGVLSQKLEAVRRLVRDMGARSGVPIEPESQTRLLDALGGVDGVYGGVVPGAGGYDALALLMRDDEATKKRVDDFLDGWSRDHDDSKVKLLKVKGEVEGVRKEELDVYAGWL
ncbi:phosphomevalonate kinase [Geosmithia morbida]|uniref:Phosphomevalonate kinase n=1 Tax=Geosmithia morbida TaxID=1094350 RepID=A0A9P5D7J6_9HYPO|nr:phosphomevalonate kinase [Geosmithia morbida]KAF4126706.1 phosphomevalonate kinase [Geosmithia morbida]